MEKADFFARPVQENGTIHHFLYHTKVIISYKKNNVNRSNAIFFAFFDFLERKNDKKLSFVRTWCRFFVLSTVKIREHHAGFDIN